MSEKNFEKDVGQTGDFFKYLHSNMKSSMPFWDDFLQRGQRFQRSLEQTIVTFNSFLDGFAKLAELATNSKGATHEIGISLTNVIRWQKAMELKIRELNFSLSTKVLTPVGHRLDEWKKQLSNLDKDHDKEMNRPLKETKELLKNTIKSHKTIENKKKKDKQVAGLQAQFEQLQMETNQHIADIEQKEKVHMSRVMVEERVWYSTLTNTFMTVLDQLVTVGTDFDRLPNLMSDLKESSSSPSILPEAKRDFIEEWQIPSIHTPRLRGGSVHHSSINSVNIARTESILSFDNGGQTDGLQISSPIMPPTPPPQEPPTLANCTQQHPSNPHSNYPPPSNPHTNYPHQHANYPPIEDHYDIPAVSSSYASVSPSQVSLVSNGSHYSSESTVSSTRSASPQMTRTTVPPNQGFHQLPPTSGTHPLPSTQPLYQSPVHHYHNDLPFVNRSDMTPSAMKYIPATLPRPRKDTNPKPTAPKPNRNMSLTQQYPHQTQQHHYRTSQDNSPQHYQQSAGNRLIKQSSLPEQDQSDDDENMSAFALALKQKKLRKTVHVSDKSIPRI